MAQAEKSAEPHHDHDHSATSHRRFDDVERWVEVFDDPERDSWQHPQQVLQFLGISEGQTVADVGAGTGYFTVLMAQLVGESGKVYAVDVEPALVKHLEERTAKAGLFQVVPVLAEPDDPLLPEGGVDLVLIVDTWHHIEDRIDYLATLAATLKPGGRVGLVDWRKGELPKGPPPGHKLSREEVILEFREAGWTLASESDELPYQYLLVFAPPS